MISCCPACSDRLRICDASTSTAKQSIRCCVLKVGYADSVTLLFIVLADTSEVCDGITQDRNGYDVVRM